MITEALRCRNTTCNGMFPTFFVIKFGLFDVSQPPLEQEKKNTSSILDTVRHINDFINTSGLPLAVIRLYDYPVLHEDYTYKVTL